MGEIIATVDQHAREVNRSWGFNRLPHLVPIALAEAFKRQKGKWEMACFECCGSLVPDDLNRVRKHGEAMLRAFEAMELAAIKTGHSNAPPTWWEFELENGTPVLLVRDRAEISQVDAGGRAVQIWSLEEVAHIIAKFPQIAASKEMFPGAEVVQLKTSKRTHDALDDKMDGLPFSVAE